MTGLSGGAQHPQPEKSTRMGAFHGWLQADTAPDSYSGDRFQSGVQVPCV